MIICDTGPLVSAALTRDADHARCAELFNNLHVARTEILIPATVVAEVGHMLGRELGTTVGHYSGVTVPTLAGIRGLYAH